MNMNPANRCPGSGRTIDAAGRPSHARPHCPVCGKGVRVQTNGRAYEHSKVPAGKAARRG